MSETDTLSRAELERYDPQPLVRGDHADYLCPFCHDERVGRPRDNAHRKLRVWLSAGSWHCVRCERSGLLEEFKTPPEERARRPKGRRRSSPSGAIAYQSPTLLPATDKQSQAKCDRLRSLWERSVPIGAPEAELGAAYLRRRGIATAAATAARVRYNAAWPDGPGHRHAAVLFPMGNATGHSVVAVDARYLEPRPDSSKTKTRGLKRAGVFVATPGALDKDGVCICEGPITALSLAVVHKPAVALAGHHDAPVWLVRRLALCNVFLAFDWYEPGRDADGAKLAARLVVAGAKPWRLRSPGAGDWNDELVKRGPDELRKQLDNALETAFVSAS